MKIFVKNTKRRCTSIIYFFHCDMGQKENKNKRAPYFKKEGYHRKFYKKLFY